MKKLQKESELFSKMRMRMWEAHASFEIFRAIQYSKAIDIHGKEIAENNAKTLSRHIEFFTPIMQSLYAKSTLGLWQFFDKEENLGYKALLKEMKPFTNHKVYQDFLYEIEETLSPHTEVIKKLQTIRHEQIAHASKDAEEVELTMDEVEELYKATQEIFNLLSGHFEGGFTMFPLNQEEAKADVGVLLRDLHLGFEEFKRKIRQNEQIDLSYKK